jgi:Lon protease-like protein
MPLQIFEQRYLDLVRSCTREGTGFGQVWLAQGHEVMGAGEGAQELGLYGTYAHIVDWDSLPNGLLGITIEGGQRFAVLDSFTEAGQLVMGEVEMLEQQPCFPLEPEWQSMLDVLSSLERHPHVQRLGIDVDHEDAWQVGYALVQLLPVDEQIKYELLGEDEIESFMARLDLILNELGGVEQG